MSEVKKYLKELELLRNRKSKKALTVEERCDILERIYDGCLFLMEQTVVIGSFKGVGGCRTALEGARLELESWMPNKKSKSNDVVIRCEFGSLDGDSDE